MERGGAFLQRKAQLGHNAICMYFKSTASAFGMGPCWAIRDFASSQHPHIVTCCSTKDLEEEGWERRGEGEAGNEIIKVMRR